MGWMCPVCEDVCSCPKCARDSGEHDGRGGGKGLGRKPTVLVTTHMQPKSHKVKNICCICYISAGSGSTPTTMSLHPHVKQDGEGKPLLLCDGCYGDIKTKRERAKRTGQLFADGDDQTEDICSCCADGEKTDGSAMDLFCCDTCHRAYCQQCCNMLLTPKQLRQMHASDLWICCHCTPEVGEKKKAASKAKANKGNNKLKIKAFEQDDDFLVETQSPKDKKNSMSVNKYMAAYIQATETREAAMRSNCDYEHDTEDCCFCCKDGGELIECDWHRDDPNGLVCPKVYHDSCLGFAVPEDESIKWYCPRHFCMKCGQKNPAYSCRFCPMSFCPTDLPDDVTILGDATPDLQNVTFVTCGRCSRMQTEAIAEGLMGASRGNLLKGRKV